MTIAGPILINACATEPSGPGRRFSSTASNVSTQKLISDSASVQINLGMTTDDSIGTPLTSLAKSPPGLSTRPRYRRSNALVQLQARDNHCGEAASEKCLSAATFVRRLGA